MFNPSGALNYSKYRPLASILALGLSFIAYSGFQPVHAQRSLENGTVLPMGDWLEFKQATFSGTPLRLHLRTGYERAVLLPEAVRLENSDQELPGCEIFIDHEIVGFYPTKNFKREKVRLVGLETGEVYELYVRSSTSGMRQPLQINR